MTKGVRIMGVGHKLGSFLRVGLRVVGMVILILLAISIVTAVVCFFIGVKSIREYGNALSYAGLLTLGITGVFALANTGGGGRHTDLGHRPIHHEYRIQMMKNRGRFFESALVVALAAIAAMVLASMIVRYFP
jgi:hypothetical protein